MRPHLDKDVVHRAQLVHGIWIEDGQKKAVWTGGNTDRFTVYISVKSCRRPCVHPNPKTREPLPPVHSHVFRFSWKRDWRSWQWIPVSVEEEYQNRYSVDTVGVRFPNTMAAQAALSWFVRRMKEMADSSVPSAESRQKGTDETVESSTCTSQDVHGGDSASQEVPDGQSAGGNQAPRCAKGGSGEGGGEEARLSSSPADQGGDEEVESSTSPKGSTQAAAGESGSSDQSGRVPDGCERAGSSSSDAPNAPTPGADGAGEGIGAPLGDDGVDDIAETPESEEDRVLCADAPAGEAEEGAERTEDVRNILRQFRALSSRGGSNAPSLRGKRAHGGVFACLADTDPPSRDLVARARRAFARMIRGGEIDPFARWNARRVSVKVAGFLRPWDVGDRRHESGRPAILVLPDVSGSMSAFARDVLRLAVVVGRIGMPGADVIVVAHSNGFPEEISLNGRPASRVRIDADKYGGDCLRATWAWYVEVIRRYNVQAALVAADWDGAWLYKQLAATMDVYWLDIWSSRRFEKPRVVPFPPRFLVHFVADLEDWFDWPDSAIRRVRYAFACRTAEDGIAALEEIFLRAKPRSLS